MGGNIHNIARAFIKWIIGWKKSKELHEYALILSKGAYIYIYIIYNIIYNYFHESKKIDIKGSNIKWSDFENFAGIIFVEKLSNIFM